MAALYAVFAFCRNIPASEKSLLRRSGLLPGTRHHVVCQSSSRRNPLAGALAAVTEPKAPENLASQRGVSHVGPPSTVVPFRTPRARAATHFRRSPIPVCRLMLRVPLGPAAASSAVEAGAGGAASPPLCPARYRSQ